MTFKTLSAIAILTATFGSPVFAQGLNADGTAIHRQSSATRHFRNSYDHALGFAAGARAGEDFFTEAYGMDPSRPGGRDPDFSPATN